VYFPFNFAIRLTLDCFVAMAPRNDSGAGIKPVSDAEGYQGK